MSQTSCIDAFRRFLEGVVGRLSFEEMERRFSRALEENPVFTEIERRGALGKNIIIVLGGRGCGKTLTIRYIKYRLERDGWDFKYISGAQLVEQAKAGAQGSRVFQQLIEEQESKLGRDSGYRVVVAIDDVAEAVEIAREFLQKEVELARKYEGRLKLVLAAQSERAKAERVMTVELLKVVLSQAPFAEMFFGEEPKRVLLDSFRNSYISGTPVITFRGATMINLDAYWSSLRSLNRVKDLAEAMVKLAKFYAENAGACCEEVVKRVEGHKHGLALLALSSIPKIVRDPEARAVIEYRGAEPSLSGLGIVALNGLGIAELLNRFFADPKVASLADEAEKVYQSLKSLQATVDADTVKEVLLKACGAVGYMTPLRDLPVSSIVPQQAPSGASKPVTGRRKYGPRVDLVEVRVAASEGREERRYVIFHSLKVDKKGYVTSGSAKKLAELINCGVPSEAEMRYLVVLIPAAEHAKALYRALGLLQAGRKGRDVLPLFIDKLSSIERGFVHAVEIGILGDDRKISQELQEVLYRIVVGTLTLSLRDDAGQPHLAYLMLPYVS